MALYNKHFGYSTQQADNYHGEYDDEAYGALYIPHVEEQFASDKALFKQVFAEQLHQLAPAGIAQGHFRDHQVKQDADEIGGGEDDEDGDETVPGGEIGHGHDAAADPEPGDHRGCLE